MTTFDIDTFMMGPTAEEALEERRQFAIDNCLRQTAVTDPLTKQKEYSWYRCKNFRECKNCAEQRAKEELEYWEMSEECGLALKMVELSSEAEVRALTRKVKQYRRYPLNGEYVVVFSDNYDHQDSIYLGDCLLTKGELALALTATPPKKKVTGKLVPTLKAIEKEERVIEDEVEVQVPKVMFTNAAVTKDLLDEIHQQAYEETLSSMPPTAETIQFELDKLTRKEFELYREHEIEYTVLYYMRRKFSISKARWQITSNKDLDKNNRRYPPPIADMTHKEFNEFMFG